MNACTIIARNYLAYARVLAASYARHHPGQRLSALVLDGHGAPLDSETEPFETIFPEQLPLTADELHKMATIYDVTELATALKPFFLRFLLDRGADAVMFLDPDIEVFAPLDELGLLAREHGIVVIPHMLRPIPADGRKPTQADLASSGVYNLGFIAVSADADKFLEWWGAALRRDCLVAPEEHLFVDQRLLDFLPGYARPHIVQDPAFDVAYWNLHERRVSWTGTRYEVAGTPLRFFHFSGFNPMVPHLLSKHQADAPRILLSEEPDLARLCREYADRLLAAAYVDCATIPYGFSRTAHGVPFDRRMRRIYREALLAAGRGEGDDPPDPLDPAESEAFMAWLNSPEGGSGGPSRYLRRLYDERADLRAAFPDLSGPDLRRYLDWVRADGSAEPPVPAILRVAPRPRAPARPEPPTRSSPHPDRGVNIVGYVRAELGTGEGARLTVAAVKAAGIPYTVIAHGDTSSRQEHAFEDFGAEHGWYDVNLVHLNADMLPRFAEREGRKLLQGRYTVGIWAWEVEVFPPDMAAAARYADEIWAVSEFAAAVIRKHVAKPVFAFPHPVIPPTPIPLSRAELGLPDVFVFLFCFDFFSIMERKNPEGLIEAFRRAFAPDEGPVLVIKTINGGRAIDRLEKLRAAIAGRSDIRIIDGYLPHPQVHALMSACDAYVSLHRGEGFGLTLAEAMALGKPVIATGYSGNLDFMNEANSYLVPFDFTSIPPGCDPYPAGTRWAAPNLDEAARLMRVVYERPAEARAVGERARQDILRLHSPQMRSAFLRARLAAIRQAPPAGAPSREYAPVPVVSYDPGPGPAAVEAVAELVATEPPLGSQYRSVRLIQRVLLRLLRPLLNHQRALGDKLVQALDELQHTLERRQREGLLELERRVNERVGAASRDLFREIAHMTADTQKDIRGEIKSLAGALDDLRGKGTSLAEDTAEKLSRLLAELHSAAHVWDPSLLSGLPDAAGRPIVGYHSATLGPAAHPYLLFEEIFRGPESAIRDRQRPYVETLRGHGPILDVGCGRGEMLDLCREAGILVLGVDIDAGMVERCRAKGHRVECADALDYLTRQANGSIRTIFSAQFIEHLRYDRLIQFLQLSYRTLTPDGLFVAETVNPHSIQAFKAFWTDLTHERPIFPETLLALCRLYGFEEASIVFPTGRGDAQADRWTAGDYAVVARRGWPDRRAE